jgi:anti-sigma regulatory factor (Ser/Thr protein kinase)
MRELAERAGFGGRANDITLATAELIANAQEHGRPPIVVEAWAEGRLVIEVRDSGGGLDHQAVWQRHPPSPYDHRGRGLWIVRQLMDVVVVRSDEHGTTIRVELSPEPHLGA